MMRVALTIAAAGLTSAASAQYDKGTWLFEVIGGPVSPSNPVVTVKLYAAFPIYTPGETALGDANLGILSSDPHGWFYDMQKGSDLLSECSLAFLGNPTPSGGVEPLVFKQLGVLGCQPNPAAPCHVWEAKWTTDDFTPRDVVLESWKTGAFAVFSDLGQIFPNVSLYPDKFEHGSGVIQVVPAPGGAILLAGSIGIAVRRRR